MQKRKTIFPWPLALAVAWCALATGCGGGAEPPAHPPKIAPVHPSVEKAPPATSAPAKK